MNEVGYDYSFDPGACESCGGNCCTGESGYIYLNQNEMEAIAQHLELPLGVFKEEYLLKNGYKFSIREHVIGDSHDCIFFDRQIKGCGIYPVRPTQCRTFPFWPYFKTHKAELEAECPGISFHPTEPRKEDDV
jgi:Fe-S-cluster containining protein